jgi:DNA polymerase delta subunit 1
MDDSFDGMGDASLLEALEEEELMLADAGKPHPQATPTPDPGNLSRQQDLQQAAPGNGVSSNASRREWTRPPPPPIDPTADTISFQQIDIDHYTDSPIPGMPGLQSGVVPVIRMYGVTMEGNSVCAHLHGFLPYFYLNYPREDFAAEHCSDFRASLNAAVLGDMKSNRDNITTAVVSVEICQR